MYREAAIIYWTEVVLLGDGPVDRAANEKYGQTISNPEVRELIDGNVRAYQRKMAQYFAWAALLQGGAFALTF
jgi:hypothetical protein